MKSLKQKVYSHHTKALDMIQQWKKEGKKIVFTNGCFDIIHVGHVLYLESARSLGDILIVGINSDISVRKLKGLSRPINDELSRSYVLASLASVDAAIIFEEDDPLNVIKSICPDVLVKGGDWKPDQIIGGDFVTSQGGEVHSLPFVDGYSTTSIENKIKNS
ncbi:MAG: D-glycero-beta-D-manno-heptose 1-phosphate adenylyltransferase [Saprospiraceae bacterium]|jgi:rfaE bifunctional protein nucleotidyltransferase chain/domain|nr:D-glycero-beta-D-manno-heptose 1-phosphate adenylyltransferase [Saprospiraceae bacterium]